MSNQAGQKSMTAFAALPEAQGLISSIHRAAHNCHNSRQSGTFFWHALKYSIRALVQNDTLLQVKGTGANGSFKLNRKKLEGGAERRGASAASSPAPKARTAAAADRTPARPQPERRAHKAKKAAAAAGAKKVKKAAKPNVPKVPKGRK